MDRNSVAIGTMQEVADNDEPPLLEAPYGGIKLAENAKPNVRLDLFPVNKQSNDFRNKYSSKVSQTEWSSLKWQTVISITSITQHKALINYVVDQELEPINVPQPFRITPYYVTLIDSLNAIGHVPIRSSNELHCPWAI